MIKLALEQGRLSGGKGANATLANGLAYEKRVSSWLESYFDFHPQLVFELENRQRFIPDGLIFNSDYSKLCVVEIKNQHSDEGVKQLLGYCFHVQRWFRKPVSGALICQTYRPELGGKLYFDLPQLLAEPLAFGVVAVGTRNLPRLNEAKKHGLGAGAGVSNLFVRAAGTAGDGAGGGCGSTLPSSP